MLTLKNIEDLYEKGWKIKLFNKRLIKYRARCFPECKKIEIYKNKIRNKVDLDVTILHEFIHAQDYEFENLDECGIQDDKSYENLTEKRAMYVYSNFPDVINKIKKLYINDLSTS